MGPFINDYQCDQKRASGIFFNYFVSEYIQKQTVEFRVLAGKYRAYVLNTRNTAAAALEWERRFRSMVFKWSEDGRDLLLELGFSPHGF